MTNASWRQVMTMDFFFLSFSRMPDGLVDGVSHHQLQNISIRERRPELTSNYGLAVSRDGASR
jgi:hypothetical protein